MKVKNPGVLTLFRGPGRCEYCNRYCTIREPHHLVRRGLGGGSTLDIPINLAGLCNTVPGYYTGCHAQHHNGEISDDDILAVVSKREKCLQGDIRDVCNWLLALPKNPSERQVEVSLKNWQFTGTGLKLARKTWEEINERYRS